MHSGCHFQHNVKCLSDNLCIVTECFACFKDEDFGGECHDIESIYSQRLKMTGKVGTPDSTVYTTAKTILNDSLVIAALRSSGPNTEVRASELH